MNSQIFIYQTESGKTKIEVRLENETVWLNQVQMAELFDKGRSTISEHIQNIFEEGELGEETGADFAVLADFEESLLALFFVFIFSIISIINSNIYTYKYYI